MMQDGADTASDYNRLELSLVDEASVEPEIPLARQFSRKA